MLMLMRAGSCADPQGLGHAADKAANAFLIEALRRHRPEDAILSEESPDDPVRLERARVWIIDPLDGTREYCEGRDDWAVHVGLAVDGRPAAGVVAVPALERIFRSDRPAAPAAPRLRPLLLVSRSRPPEQAAALAAHLGADVREMGSAGAKAMAVVAGEADLYIHAGGQREWDNCAPAAVALGAGLHASRLDGGPLLYNRADTCVPDLVIGRRELAERLVAFVRAGQG
ncbi:MAG: 3'(2'),5'-bisphosphate nucleotidase CysQ [Sphingomonas sp.]|nr:3'(2'),5'-bisphosphate nucleotidase CysQ [Sphingomonas sp.]